MPLDLESTVRLSSGHAMPVLGLGVYRNYTTRDSVLEAFSAGYRHVDTAQAYRNEAHVGEALRESGLARSAIFVTTKCISRDHGYDKTLRGVEASLGRIGGGYIDLFLIHDPYSGKARRLETYRALLDCKKAGTVRSVGVSNYGVKHLEEIREAGMEMPSVNQIELHPLCQQKPIVEYCREHEIVVQAYSPLVQGKMDHPVFRTLSQKYGKDAAQILIRWSLQKGFVPLPKSANPARIRSNTQVFDFKIEAEDMETLDALDLGAEGAVTWNPVNVD